MLKVSYNSKKLLVNSIISNYEKGSLEAALADLKKFYILLKNQAHTTSISRKVIALNECTPNPNFLFQEILSGVIYLRCSQYNQQQNYCRKYISSLNFLCRKLNESESIRLFLTIDDSIKDLIQKIIINHLPSEELFKQIHKENGCDPIFSKLKCFLYDIDKYSGFLKNEHQFFVVLLMIGLLLSISFNLFKKCREMIVLVTENLDLNLCSECEICPIGGKLLRLCHILISKDLFTKKKISKSQTSSPQPLITIQNCSHVQSTSIHKSISAEILLQNSSNQKAINECSSFRKYLKNVSSRSSNKKTTAYTQHSQETCKGSFSIHSNDKDTKKVKGKCNSNQPIATPSNRKNPMTPLHPKIRIHLSTSILRGKKSNGNFTPKMLKNNRGKNTEHFHFTSDKEIFRGRTKSALPVNKIMPIKKAYLHLRETKKEDESFLKKSKPLKRNDSSSSQSLVGHINQIKDQFLQMEKMIQNFKCDTQNIRQQFLI